MVLSHVFFLFLEFFTQLFDLTLMSLKHAIMLIQNHSILLNSLTISSLQIFLLKQDFIIGSPSDQLLSSEPHSSLRIAGCHKIDREMLQINKFSTLIHTHRQQSLAIFFLLFREAYQIVIYAVLAL